MGLPPVCALLPIPGALPWRAFYVGSPSSDRLGLKRGNGYAHGPPPNVPRV